MVFLPKPDGHARGKPWEKHTYLVIIELDKLFSSLQDAESGQRGYVITGNRKYLDPYHRALRTVEAHLATLRRLTRDNPEQQGRLLQIEPLIQTKLALLEAAIRLRASAGFESARDRIMTDAGRSTMDTLRALIDRAVYDESLLLRQRAVVERRFSDRNFNLLLMGNLLGIIILSTLYLFLWREFTRRIRNERAGSGNHLHHLPPPACRQPQRFFPRLPLEFDVLADDPLREHEGEISLLMTDVVMPEMSGRELADSL